MPSGVVSISDLRVELEHGAIPLVQGFDLRISRGEVVGLVGETGSGKTTVGLALLGYARPGARITHGSIKIDGHEVVGASPRALRAIRGRSITYLPQDPGTALNPMHRIGNQLREMLDVHRSDLSPAARDARVTEVLAETNLPTDGAFLERRPHQLSGGQQQRVTIALAFVCQPSVVVLDEPTTGLDVATQQRVLSLVRRMSDINGAASLYITHDLDVVAGMADTTVVLYAGRVAEIGPTARLFEQPAHPYTRGLLAAVPEGLDGNPPVGIPGRAPLPSERLVGCPFVPRCRFAVASCEAGFPPPVEIGPGHRAHCLRIDDVLRDVSDTAPEPRVPVGGIDKRALVVQGLEVRYGDHVAASEISFQLRRGQWLAFVGESGSGKTTIARAMAGIRPASSGDILLEGRPVPYAAEDRAPDIRRAIAYVFQNPYASLNPRKTIEASLLQPMSLFRTTAKSERADRIAATLQRVGLGTRILRQRPAQLSGGERQRVAIARALLAEPTFLICDEVTSSLDVSVQATILELLAELQGQMQLGLLFITHDLSVAASVASDVIVLHQGRIVEAGPVKTVFESPQSEYARLLVSAAAGVRGAGSPTPARP